MCTVGCAWWCGSFLTSQLIPEDARERFDNAIASVLQLRSSTFIELGLIAVVYGVGVFVIWRLYAVLDKTAWYTVPAVASSSPFTRRACGTRS